MLNFLVGRRNDHSTATLIKLYSYQLAIMSLLEKNNKNIDFKSVTKETIKRSKNILDKIK